MKNNVEIVAEMVNQGMKSREIADRTGRSIHYINNCRQKAVRRGLCQHGHAKMAVVGRMVASSGEVIEVRFDSIYQAGEAGYERSSVWACVHGKQLMHAGYTWERA